MNFFLKSHILCQGQHETLFYILQKAPSVRALRFVKRSMSNINKIICLIILKSPENLSPGFNGSIGSVNIIHYLLKRASKYILEEM